jgi:hypothetical protein
MDEKLKKNRQKIVKGRGIQKMIPRPSADFIVVS